MAALVVVAHTVEPSGDAAGGFEGFGLGEQLSVEQLPATAVRVTAALAAISGYAAGVDWMD